MDEVLEKFSRVSVAPAGNDEHYTFVELHRVREDARVLLDPVVIGDYIKRNCPAPFDASFAHAKAIDATLRVNVADYASVEIQLNGNPLYKPYPKDYSSPEFERIFTTDKEGAPLEGFCWYCGHVTGGQFDEKEDSGLVFRVKNFAVGDRQLTRKSLWKSTPERAFWFFGEFHVVDPDVVPSSDRTDFEDNDARSRLFLRGRRVAQVLSSRAGQESEVRRLELKTDEAHGVFSEKNRMARRGELSDVLRDDVRYDVRRAVEDLEERLRRAKGRRELSERHKRAVASARTVAKSGRKLLKTLARAKSFYDVGAVLHFNDQTREAYRVIPGCLREELSGDARLFARVVRRIDEALRRRFGVQS